MNRAELELNGTTKFYYCQKIGDQLWIHFNGESFSIDAQAEELQHNSKHSNISESQTNGRTEGQRATRRTGSSAKPSTGQVLAPMPGKVIKVNCKLGDKVEKHQVLVVLEAMKMEYSLTSDISGTIESLEVAEGDQVSIKQVLVRVNEDS